MKAPNEFSGVWRIVHTALWDADMRDLVVPAQITFVDDGLGSFQIAVIKASIDCQFEDDVVQFSWNGHDHGRPACGRGEATIKNGTLYCKLHIHAGGETWFMARRDEDVVERDPTSSDGGH
jgi:hypothetical protein